LPACPDDDDGDGFAEPEDCNDLSMMMYPSASEAENGVDDDCDGRVDEGTRAFDDDADGYTEAGGDCDDGDANLGPGGDPCGPAEAAADSDAPGETDPGEDSWDFGEDRRAFGEGEPPGAQTCASWPQAAGTSPVLACLWLIRRRRQRHPSVSSIAA
jgi:hypothetical protein